MTGTGAKHCPSAWQQGLHSLFASGRELLFPSSCLNCERRLPHARLPLFCDDCLPSIPVIQAPRCTICGLPFDCGGSHTCGVCLTEPPAYRLARSALVYRPPVISLISSLKFKGSLTGLATLAKLAKTSPGFRDLSPPDLIIPMPLHANRLRRRGFNQALLIARACFPESRHKIDTRTLVKNRDTSPQTELNRKKRKKNISGAFSVIQAQKVAKRRILLIDDVLTTGSTANESSRALYRSGAAQVEIFTLARATL